MTAIVTRTNKGQALTWAEMDSNLTNLNNNKLEITDAAATYETQTHAASTYDTKTNTAATYATKVSPTTSGTHTHTGDTTTSGNITLTGVNKTIAGDFTSAIGTKNKIQTTTLNGATVVPVVPNGTSTGSGIDLYSTSSGTNGYRFSFQQQSNSSLFATTSTGASGGSPIILSYTPLSGSTVSATLDANGLSSTNLIGSVSSKAPSMYATNYYNYDAESGTTNLINYGSSRIQNQLQLGGSGLAPYLASNMWNNFSLRVETSPANKCVSLWKPIGNSTTVTLQGFNAFTAVGTATARTVTASTNQSFTRSKRLGYVSAATAGSLAGHYDTVAQYSTADTTYLSPGFKYTCRFSLPQQAIGQRAFIGLSSSVAAPTNVDPATLLNCIGIFLNGTYTTNFGFISANATNSTIIDTAMYASVDGTTTSSSVFTYELTIEHNNINSNMVFLTLKVITGFNLSSSVIHQGYFPYMPAGNTLLAHRAWICNNTTASAVAIDVHHVQIETSATSE